MSGGFIVPILQTGKFKQRGTLWMSKGGKTRTQIPACWVPALSTCPFVQKPQCAHAVCRERREKNFAETIKVNNYIVKAT